MKFVLMLLPLLLMSIPAYAAGGEDDFMYGTPVYKFFETLGMVAAVYGVFFPALFLAFCLFKFRFRYHFLVCSVFFEWIAFWAIVVFLEFFRR